MLDMSKPENISLEFSIETMTNFIQLFLLEPQHSEQQGLTDKMLNKFKTSLSCDSLQNITK
ncbi:CLUMA_CG005136, isoform A [Clunio marinus]|uniref:CLUMA_CG005136, isoform A n=1 Tax=Clunio marinus TaxID=568069 RepID=A0A1J1HTZ3_9DIPT|nr:CLUMA_CG005136, isoform A [Clunio marinus]